MESPFQFVSRWTKIISSFLSYQLLNQAIAFLTGVLIIRSVDKTEYAWYSLTTSLAGGLTNLSMLGIGVVFIALGGERFNNRVSMGRLFSTAVFYRRIFAMVSGPIVIGLLAFLLWKNNCPPAYIGVLVVLVLANFLILFYQSFYSAIFQLQSQYNYPQKISVFGGLSRLVLIGFLTVTLIQAWSIWLVTLFVQLTIFIWFLKPKAETYFEKGQSIDPAAAQKIKQVTFNTLPNSLSGFIMPQLSVLLISYFGSTSSVAELGALSRLAMIFSILGVLNSSVFQPMLARSGKGDQFLRRSFIVIIFNTVSAGVFFGGLFLFQNEFLFILGPEYSGLNLPLLLLAGQTCLGHILWVMNSILNSKAWTRGIWIAPIITVLCLIIGLCIFDLSTLQGVILVGYIRIPFVALLFVIIFWVEFFSHKKKHA